MRSACNRACKNVGECYIDDTIHDSEIASGLPGTTKMDCKMKRVLFLCAVAFGLVGCTSIEVKPLAYDPELTEISLIDNPRVIVHDFVPVLEKHLAERGIGLKRVSEFAQLERDEYGIRYSARQSWTFVTYLSDAYVRIYKGNLLVAEGRYHLIGQFFCLSLFKWQGTETKMKPVYDELLKKFPAAEEKRP